MICKVCHCNKDPHLFGKWRYKNRYGIEVTRTRATCNACRSAIEKRRQSDARREQFRRLTSWPVP